MITMTHSTSEYTLRNPSLMNTLSIKKKLLEGRSAAGVLYLYSKGIKIYRMRLTWTELNEDEKNTIETAFDTIGTASFTYTDHKGSKWTALIVSETIEFGEVHDEEFAGYRIRGRYSVAMEIEVTPYIEVEE